MLLILLIFSLTETYAQSKFMRATQMHFGTYDNNRWNWDEGHSSSTLISIDSKLVTIYEGEGLKLHLLDSSFESEKFNAWDAVDQDGDECEFGFGITEEGKLKVVVKYNNRALLYYLDVEK
jgi:hypothetical protein